MSFTQYFAAVSRAFSHCMYTTFPQIVAAATTILFWILKAWKFHIVSSLSFPLCNENLNSILTCWGNYSRDYMRKYGICSFQQCEYCEIGNVSMGFSKSLMPKISYKSLVFDSWFDKIFGICDLENPILTFPPHSILSLLKTTIVKKLLNNDQCTHFTKWQ